MEERFDPPERRAAAAPGNGASWPANGATAMPPAWTQHSAGGVPPWGEPVPQPAGPSPVAPAPPRRPKSLWKRALGPLIAVGFVLLLLIHEMGHVLQLRREGIKASAPMFIPFLGAAVAMKQMPKDAAAEARVGLAGPILGSLGCLVPIGL
ncbi:MAG: hypothetical protein M3088_00215, partial [Actinomycetota bacterium]|nr:hypothetical protein [Actinomycetota bacterium]